VLSQRPAGLALENGAVDAGLERLIGLGGQEDVAGAVAGAIAGAAVGDVPVDDLAEVQGAQGAAVKVAVHAEGEAVQPDRPSTSCSIRT
jgi:hypothetical protein